MIRFLLILAITALIVSLLPFANLARHESLTLSPADLSFRASATAGMPVRVHEVDGGIEPQWMIIGTSKVASESIRQAVQRSFRNAGYGTGDDKANCRIDISLNDQESIESLFGSSLKRTVIMTYTVTRDGIGKAIVLQTTGTASLADSLILTERTRIALERALKENIKQFFDFVTLELRR